ILTTRFLVAVKYLREVTPYFRKASIIQEVGWELQRGFLSATPPPPKSPPRADTRYLPLQLCRLTRAHPSSDPDKVKRTSEIEELNPILGLSWTERKTARENSCAVKREEGKRQVWSARGGAERDGDRRGMDNEFRKYYHLYYLKQFSTFFERRFCCVECACLHDTCDREHHFAVENVQLHSSRVENKQASLYSSPFRKLAGAFLDHELQKPVCYQRIQVCEAIDYIVRQARLCDVLAHHWSPGPFTKTSATGCKSYLNWRWQVYPSGRLTSESIGSLRGINSFICSSCLVHVGLLNKRSANEAKAASKDESAARKPDGIVEHGLLTCDRIRIQISSNQFWHAVTDGSLKCTRATSVHNLKLSCHPLAKLYGAFIMFPATVTRKLLGPGLDGRILELHSPDGVHECWLRAADNTEANVWFNALHSALAALTLKALRLASALPDPQQLQHIGWLARRHCLQGDGKINCRTSDIPTMLSKLRLERRIKRRSCTCSFASSVHVRTCVNIRASVSTREYSSPLKVSSVYSGGTVNTRTGDFKNDIVTFPLACAEALPSWLTLASPALTFTLLVRAFARKMKRDYPWLRIVEGIAHILPKLHVKRLVSSPTRQNEAASSSSGSTQHGATFAVRVGTMDGVVTHHLRAETRRDLAAWARAIVQGCHTAAHSLREYTVRCTWQGKACQLVVNHEEGFALYSAGTRGTAGNGVSPGSPPTPLWRRSFDKLKMSADDGARLLWLDFGGEDGEIELDLESCPKPIVFVLHNFLSAKIHRLGLSA
ncbi:Beta-1-syntrophin, partial [Atta colombica]